MANQDYEEIIGLEVHAELSTKTKIFCSCPTEFGADPNTHVCPVCMAMPGVLPVLNEKVVEYAVKAGLATNCSISQDSKNDRKNYAIRLSDEYIENIRKELPEMPESRKARYISELHLSEKDSNYLTSSKALSDIFEKTGKICKNYKAVCNWLNSDIARILNEKEIEPEQIPFTAEQLAELVELIDAGTISSSIGKKVLYELFENPRSPKNIIKEKGWIQISDENAIKDVVLQVLSANPQSIADFKAGKDRALGFLVGQAMKATKGKANPQMLNKMFLEELKK